MCRTEGNMRMRNLGFTLFFLILLVSCCFAQQNGQAGKVQVINASITNVAPTNGKLMFETYCASCHGANGGGSGPAAAAMKTTPTNLTTLARMNNGEYPTLHVMQTIRGDATYPAHGSKDMPVWGTAFRALQFDKDPSIDVQRRITSLDNYIASLQKK